MSTFPLREKWMPGLKHISIIIGADERSREYVSCHELEAEQKTRTKCQYCGKLTKVATDVKDHAVFQRMREIK